MSETKKEIIDMLNKALEMEHQARIQYLSHAELIDGLQMDPIIARIKEISEDEEEHAEKFRTLIGDYLDGTPTMELAETKKASSIKEILQINLEDEKEAVEYYSKILAKIRESKQELPYSFFQMEHEVRHIIMDEMEHISEIRQLLNKNISEVEAE